MCADFSVSDNVPQHNTPSYPQQQPSDNGPYHYLSDFDLLRVFCGVLDEADFIDDIRSKVSEMKHDQYHKIDMTKELDDLEAVYDEARYRVYLHDFDEEQKRKRRLADTDQRSSGGEG